MKTSEIKKALKEFGKMTMPIKTKKRIKKAILKEVRIDECRLYGVEYNRNKPHAVFVIHKGKKYYGNLYPLLPIPIPKKK